MAWLRKLFGVPDPPRCDFTVCEDRTHGWVHTTNAGQRYVPIRNLVRKEMKRLGIGPKPPTEQSAKRQK